MTPILMGVYGKHFDKLFEFVRVVFFVIKRDVTVKVSNKNESLRIIKFMI